MNRSKKSFLLFALLLWNLRIKAFDDLLTKGANIAGAIASFICIYQLIQNNKLKTKCDLLNELATLQNEYIKKLQNYHEDYLKIINEYKGITHEYKRITDSYHTTCATYIQNIRVKQEAQKKENIANAVFSIARLVRRYF